MAEQLGEKTEAPSQGKINRTRQQGSLPKSIDLTGTIDLIAALMTIYYFGAALTQALAVLLRRLLAGEGPGDPFDPASAVRSMGWAMSQGFIAAWPMFAIMFVVVLLAHLHQTKGLVTLTPLMPNLARLNPISGLGKFFNKRTLVKTLASIVKLVIVIAVVYSVVSGRLQELANLPRLGALQAFGLLFDLLVRITTWLLALLLAIALVDWFYQNWQYLQDLKMTKQEVKDERRSSEGDEESKQRGRKLGREMILQGIKKNVPKADVIVTNPTHFSVAIKYDQDKMAAPRVIAKGADELAFRIREVAIAAGVPIVERPPLARGLYYHVKVGQEVKPEHYQAVAEVLAYVYRLSEQHAPRDAGEVPERQPASV